MTRRTLLRAAATALTVAALLAPTATQASTPVSFPIGIRLAPNSRTLDFYNLHSTTSDGAHQLNAINELVKTHALNRALMTNSLRAIPATIKLAKAHSIKTVIFNDEGLPCAQLISDEANAYRQVHSSNLVMSFAPQGATMVNVCGIGPFVHNTDRLYLQMEWDQGSPTLGADVHRIIASVHHARPGLPVDVQVDTNPRANRTMTAQQLLSQIHAIQDGSANQGNSIQVFTPGYSVDPSRLPVFKQVIGTLRPTR